MLNWGGKKWRPASPTRRQPINQSVAELMKPLGEKTWQGNVWGSVIMNVEKGQTTTTTTTTLPPITYHLLAENTDFLLTESGDNIDFEY